MCAVVDMPRIDSMVEFIGVPPLNAMRTRASGGWPRAGSWRLVPGDVSLTSIRRNGQPRAPRETAVDMVVQILHHGDAVMRFSHSRATGS